ncbi:hypothetical protein [Streptomyces sp. NPDC002082]|uniref:hypothetical protein n=1 Tax=Streptomyces sp. NPDC002082 TaxID=3154772 RepID=UPI00332CA434
MELIVAPTVVPPLTPWSPSVRVRGQQPDAVVRVLADGVLKGAALVGSGDGYVPLDQALQPGQRVWAEQELHGGVTSAPPPDSSNVQVLGVPDDELLSGIHSPSPLMRCGTCLYLNGVVPGTEVTVSRPPKPPVIFTAEWTTARVGLAPLGNAEVVTVSQRRGTAKGTNTLPPAKNLPGEQLSLPVPRLLQPLYLCQSVVEFEGLLPGATVDLSRNGDVLTFCFGHTTGRGRLPSGLEPHDKLTVVQRFQHCDAASPVSAESEVTDAPPPTPWFVAPVCVSDRDVEVGGLLRGAAVEFLIGMGTGTVAHAVAGSAPHRFNLPPLGNIQTLGVRQRLCKFGEWSGTSWTTLVTAGSLQHAEILEPLHACAAAVCVTDQTRTGLKAGTRVYVVSQRWAGPIGTAVCVGDRYTDVRLDFPLTAGDVLTLETVRCGIRHSSGEARPVMAAPEQFAPPEILGPADDAGRTLAVGGLVPGCWCEMEQVNSLSEEGPGIPLATHPCTREQTAVPIPEVQPGSFLRAAQRICARRSGGSHVKEIVDARPKYMPATADRICQLTGRRGPTKRGARFDTYKIGVKGTDLGIPVWHNGALRFFFGDTDEYDEDNGFVPADGDPMAWTHDLPDEPKGPLLNWATGPLLRWYTRLHVDGLPPLDNLEVPTGAFSYAGRLYVFVGRHKVGGVMCDSHLCATHGPDQDAADGLVKLYDVSSTVTPGWPGGRWLTHVSPTVVSCADWPGLPVTSGDGLVMFGSSQYHASALYLAFCPLDPLGIPAVPDPGTWWYYRAGAPADGAEPANWRTTSALLDMNPPEPTEVIPGLGLGEVSVVWEPSVHRWLEVNLEPHSPWEAIHLRSARRPEGPWTLHATVFDPGDPDADARNSDPGNQFVRLGPNSNVYAPYLIAPWTRFDRSTREVTLYYTVSTRLPVYNVQLLTARIHLGPNTP